MNESGITSRRYVPIAGDVVAAAIGMFDVWVNRDHPFELWEVGIALFTGLALLARRKSPIAVYTLTLPAVILTGALLAPMAALYTVARGPTRRQVVAMLAIFLVFLCLMFTRRSDFGSEGLEIILRDVVFSALIGVGPAALGWLVATRQRLSRQMAEIDRVHAHERELQISAARDRERTELAQEMHDAVSHQVSLIAIQAGALQMVSTDCDTRSVANIIRELSVDTLDELRHMVKVLRSPGASIEMSPLPTIQQLPFLLSASALSVDLIGQLPADLSPATERAIYRTVQEALTNVNKHAPGASVTVELASIERNVIVSITNTRSEQPPVVLPSAGSGISGLQQRAALLGGTVAARSLPDGGWQVHLQLPRA